MGRDKVSVGNCGRFFGFVLAINYGWGALDVSAGSFRCCNWGVSRFWGVPNAMVGGCGCYCWWRLVLFAGVRRHGWELLTPVGAFKVLSARYRPSASTLRVLNVSAATSRCYSQGMQMFGGGGRPRWGTNLLLLGGLSRLWLESCSAEIGRCPFHCWGLSPSQLGTPDADVGAVYVAVVWELWPECFVEGC